MIACFKRVADNALKCEKYFKHTHMYVWVIGILAEGRHIVSMSNKLHNQQMYIDIWKLLILTHHFIRIIHYHVIMTTHRKSKGIKGFRPVMEGFVVTMHEDVCDGVKIWIINTEKQIYDGFQTQGCYVHYLCFCRRNSNNIYDVNDIM